MNRLSLLSAAGLTILITAMTISGCAKLLGNLRNDLDDGAPADLGPTVGGNWTEAGLLSDDGSSANDSRYAAVGHTDRNPASDQFGGTAGRSSWLNSGNLDNNRRDLNRTAQDAESRALAYSNTPSVAPPTKRLYKNGSRATRADFVDEATNEGSLWAADGQSNYFFSKNKVRGVGDIVTITMDQALVNDSVAEVTRTLSPREKETEITLAQDKLKNKAMGIEDPATKDSVASSAAAPSRAPAAAPARSDVKDGDIRKATWADVDMNKSVEIKAGDTIMGEVVERYPNGNYKLRGTKKVRYRNGYRYVNLLGIAKGTDISDDDKIDSGKLYEYKLEAVR